MPSRKTPLNPPQEAQILVIGGGPAGSTAATLLARNGHSVVLLERARFPRYHIGESLLPSCLEVFDLLGIREKIEAQGFRRKPGANLHWGKEQWTLKFGEVHGTSTYSFNVTRAEFDHLLLKHAQEQGVQVFEEVEVEALTFEGERPTQAKWKRTDKSEISGNISFDFLIDASGQKGILANKYLRNRYSHKSFQNVAVWGYWEGASEPRDPTDGTVYVGSIDQGWLWGIPLHDGTTSVGVVMHRDRFRDCKEAGLSKVLEMSVESCPLIKKMLGDATMRPEMKIEKDYSYAAEKFAGPGYFIAGDAACFLDPLLSSGVHFATYSALLAAAAISSLIRDEVEENAAINFYEKSYRHAYLRFLVFISAFYDQARGRQGFYQEAGNLVAQDGKPQDLKEAFLSLVTGLRDMSEVTTGVSGAVVEHMTTRVRENLEMRKDKKTLAKKAKVHAPELQENARFFNAVEGFAALSSAHAIDGIYVATKPRLGLARLAAPRKAAAGVAVPAAN